MHLRERVLGLARLHLMRVSRYRLICWQRQIASASFCLS